MATMKVSNEEIIAIAKAKVKAIQYERHCLEVDFVDKINELADGIKEGWFNKRPINLWDKLLWVTYNYGYSYKFFWTTQYMTIAFLNDFNMDYNSDLYERQHEACLKLRCMAEHNEDDYLMITREEAEQLGIC